LDETIIPDKSKKRNPCGGQSAMCFQKAEILSLCLSVKHVYPLSFRLEIHVKTGKSNKIFEPFCTQLPTEEKIMLIFCPTCKIPALQIPKAVLLYMRQNL
jgi:hypothetical protein